MALDEEALRRLQRALGHAWKDAGLLLEAVTHRSFRHERPAEARRDNERLEFLGDSVLGAAAATLLFERYPDAPEGELTRRRADLVCEANLAVIARDIGIGATLRLGKGEERSGGREKPRLLASAFEACMGALYLDGGLDPVLDLARRILEPRITQIPGGLDFKSRAQEELQARGEDRPTYEMLRTSGPDHDRRFYVAMRVGERVLGEGEGRSKTEAEQNAARHALERGLNGEEEAS
jgi:ribonuclease-3